MNGRLLEAAMKGNVQLLHELLQEDVLILDRAMDVCIAKDNPVHLAALFGHANFVREILSLKPEFAWALNSKGLSPLHLASERGHVEVIKELLMIDTNLCLVRDKDGRIPLHLAAIRGRVDVLEELVNAMPITAFLLTDERVPIIHLCANHDKFEALKKLVELVPDPNEFLKLKDSDDNTILHLLVAKGRPSEVMIKYLLDNHAHAVDVNAKNTDGSTPLDVSYENENENENVFDNLRTKQILISAGAEAAVDKQLELPRKRTKNNSNENGSRWSSEAVLVVAVLMTSVAFQAALNPPGGVWQETGCHNHTANCTSNSTAHYAGESIMSYLRPQAYRAFTFSNYLTLSTSILVIFAELWTIFFNASVYRPIFIFYLAYITLIPVFTLLLSYAISLFIFVREKASDKNHDKALAWVTIVLCFGVVLLVLMPFSTMVLSSLTRRSTSRP